MQGDGELNGDALETSMDIEFTTRVIREKNIGTPRVEDAGHLMAVGLAGSLDEALRLATSELGSWLMEDYELSPSEAAIVLGTAMRYDLAEVADRNVGLVAKIPKTAIAPLKPPEAAK